MAKEAQAEVRDGERFAFGKNWQRFLRTLDDARIETAKRSLQEMLAVRDLSGRTFLDIGSGSGLFSLAAHELGADVFSFDFDPNSVACTEALRQRVGDVPRWRIERGSVLDGDYLASVGQHDVVYSWGVLHHTGDLWQALDNAQALVADGGRLYIALYNDQGWASRLWKAVKHRYNRSGPVTKATLIVATMLRFETQRLLVGAIKRVFRMHSSTPTQTNRGMQRWTDTIDWVGGWPFEVARPEQVHAFLRERGFVLDLLTTCGGRHGCNEFVLTRQAPPT